MVKMNEMTDLPPLGNESRPDRRLAVTRRNPRYPDYRPLLNLPRKCTKTLYGAPNGLLPYGIGNPAAGVKTYEASPALPSSRRRRQ